MLLLDDAIVLAGATGRVGGAVLREFAAQGARMSGDRRGRNIDDNLVANYNLLVPALRAHAGV